MARVAVILAGCGHLDGAEIREAVLTLLFLDQLGAKVQCFAPDIPQHHVMDHLKGEEVPGTRNVLEEAARVARGRIEPLSALNPKEFDALLLPGGFGVAKNLSSLAFKGKDAAVLPAYAAVIEAFFGAGKPIGAICIAPAVVALALKGRGVTLTIGDDAQTAGLIEATGNKHQACATSDVVTDAVHRVVSCSAYMREDPIAQVAEGIQKCVASVIALVSQGQERKAS